MIDALGAPQSVLVLGGTSEIATAVLDRFSAQRLRRVVLAGRDPAALQVIAQRFRSNGVAAVAVETFDAADTDTHESLLDRVWAGGDIDVALLAFGVLGDQRAAEADPGLAVDWARVNYLGGLSLGLGCARRLREQGHGVLVLLSSVAGERARRSNFVYGSAKAGLDALGQGLADALHGSGARVLVVRPGFVKDRMTRGLPIPPLSTTPAQVAEVVTAAIASGRGTVWAPPALRWVMLVLRHVPRALFRRLPI